MGEFSLGCVADSEGAIDELNPGRYNFSGKSDRIKGLEKEG